MQRVLIIGNNGVGKSTFARKLGKVTGLLVVHLDKHYWQAGWKMPDKDKWLKTVDDLITQEKWIVDGMYPSTLDKRIERADTIIFLDFPKYISLWRVLKRFVTNWWKPKVFDKSKGVPERLSWQIIYKVITFDSVAYLQQLRRLENKKVVVLKSEDEVYSFLELRKTLD